MDESVYSVSAGGQSVLWVHEGGSTSTAEEGVGRLSVG